MGPAASPRERSRELAFSGSAGGHAVPSHGLQLTQLIFQGRSITRYGPQSEWMWPDVHRKWPREHARTSCFANDCQSNQQNQWGLGQAFENPEAGEANAQLYRSHERPQGFCPGVKVSPSGPFQVTSSQHQQWEGQTPLLSQARRETNVRRNMYPQERNVPHESSRKPHAFVWTL